ncbi:MAG: uroporphyrinogen decarboxylase family protein [Candidatus Bathyarchaeia archaeon]
MNSRERVKLALQHREPDRVPIHDSPWLATVDRWRAEGLPSGVSPADYFGYEIVCFGADTSPRFPVEVLHEDDEYIVERTPFGGVRKNHRDYSTTPMIIDYPCKSRDDWERIKPRLKADDYRVDWVTGLQSFQREHSLGRFIMYSAAVGYDKIQSYVASERLLKAVIAEPEWVIDMYRVDAELAMEMCDRMMKGGFKFDGAFLFCDLGYRRGLFFSPKHFEEQLHPVFKELCRYFHSNGMYVMLHCCGRVKDLIPYFIEEGIDCLQPLEVKAGMDLIELKEKYGEKICFMGGIDVRLMALDDPKPIEKEIREKITVAKEGGGYIYHSDHSVPKNVSFQQYKRVIELVKKYGKYA